MDKAATKISDYLGSAPSVLAHLGFWSLWPILKLPSELLLVIVSLEAIIITLLVLRAERVLDEKQEAVLREIKRLAKRIEELSKEDLRATRRIERKLDKPQHNKSPKGSA